MVGHLLLSGHNLLQILNSTLAIYDYGCLMTRRFLIFGFVGPLATYLGICAFLSGMPARWADLPLAYGIELIPFVGCAFIDRWLEEARFWERAIVSGFVGFVTSAVALVIAASWLFPRLGLAVMVFGFFAIVPAALCSLLSMPAPEAPNLSRAD
jgi:hypothetical protein